MRPFDISRNGKLATARSYLLLTCRHLFDNSNDCKVRFRSASNYSDKQDIDAKVIWKAPDNIDIALVELPETIETCNPVGFGVLPDANTTKKVKFDCLGFPLFFFMVKKMLNTCIVCIKNILKSTNFLLFN